MQAFWPGALLLFIDLSALSGDGENTVPFAQVIRDGGWCMVVLIVMSLLATFMVFYFLLSLRFAVLLPKRFRAEAEELAEDFDPEGLTTLCRRSRSAGAKIIGAASRVMQDHPEADYMVVRDIVDDEGSRQSTPLWQRIQYLMDIAVVAPMVGLLGTVLGMIEAFVGLREDIGSVKPIGLANGVSKALITTAGGLIVGIIAMVLYAYFRGRVNRLVTQLEEQCSQIIQRLVFNPRRDNGGKRRQPKERRDDER